MTSTSTASSRRAARSSSRSRSARGARAPPRRRSAPSRDERPQRLGGGRPRSAIAASTRAAHRRAQPAPRRVHDAPERHRVGRVHRQPQVGEQVLHLAPLVERDAADDLVGDAALAQLGLERPRLRVRAVEHGHLAQRAARGAPASSSSRRTRLASSASSASRAKRSRAPASRSLHSVLPLRARLCAITALAAAQDVAGRAVVLLQPQHHGAREGALEVEHVRQVGAAPAVDGLVVVAHHEDVPVHGAERLHQPELRVVGVLVLVHQHVLEAPAVALAHVGAVRAAARTGAADQVVEVERARAPPAPAGRGRRARPAAARTGWPPRARTPPGPTSAFFASEMRPSTAPTRYAVLRQLEPRGSARGARASWSSRS